jgi:hypothetical protein
MKENERICVRSLYPVAISRAPMEGKRDRLPTRGLMSVRAVCAEMRKHGSEGRQGQKLPSLTRRCPGHLCEAALRPSTPTVPVKSGGAQDIQSLHRAKQRLVGSRTATINHFRGILVEFEILLGKSPKKVREGVNDLIEVPEEGLSPSLRETGRPGPTFCWPPLLLTPASGQKNPIRGPAPSS